VPVVGPRFLIEAGFIIAVAVTAGLARLSTWWIIAAVGGAWAIVAVIEIGIWARHAAVTRPRHASREREPAPPQPPPKVAVRPEPRVEPRPEPRLEPKPPPLPEPPRVVAVPPPPPEPEPEPEAVAEPEPEPARVVALRPTGDGPREWNLWELERAARDHASGDVARNEERAYLLMYLRDFAGPDGILPADFDGLVRDAFGDVLHTFAT
jgi:type IV secretory pathway VirB10-like protein